MVGDLPDYTRTINVLIEAEILSQMKQLPWWVRATPSRILCLDDLEGVLKWTQEEGTVARVTDANVFENTYALKLTTAVGQNEYAESYRELAFPGHSKLALQLFWLVPSETIGNYQGSIFVISVSDGTYKLVGGLKYLNYDTALRQKWQYYDADGNFTDVPNGAQPLHFYEPRSHYLRLVIDTTASVQKYVKLVSDYSEFDLSALPLYKSTSTARPNLDLAVGVWSNAAIAMNMYIDAVIFSDQEP